MRTYISVTSNVLLLLKRKKKEGKIEPNFSILTTRWAFALVYKKKKKRFGRVTRYSRLV